MTKQANNAPAVLRRPYVMQASTTEERLDYIDASNQRICSYVQFMRQIDGMNGTSHEVKEKAIAAFCEQMTTLERKLGRIVEDIQLE